MLPTDHISLVSLTYGCPNVVLLQAGTCYNRFNRSNSPARVMVAVRISSAWSRNPAATST